MCRLVITDLPPDTRAGPSARPGRRADSGGRSSLASRVATVFTLNHTPSFHAIVKFFYVECSVCRHGPRHSGFCELSSPLSYRTHVNDPSHVAGPIALMMHLHSCTHAHAHTLYSMFESRHYSFLKCTCHVKRSDHHAMATELYRGYRVLCLRCRRSQVRAMQVLSFPALFS